MTTIRQKHASPAVRSAFTFLALLTVGVAVGQLEEESPSRLIRFLTYSDEQRERHILFTCGLDNTDRAAAKTLARMGVRALPDIENALNSIAKRGQRSEFATNAGWLLLAYAKIKGPAALPQLEVMRKNRRFAFLQIDLDHSVALSLGLTSYLDSSREPTDAVCRAEQPRDALDRLILAWERNDRSLLEASLGPGARTALNSLLGGKTWAAMRSERWPDKSAAGSALGYRLETSAEWAEPEETLDDLPYEDATLKSVDSELEVSLRNRSGGDCGKRRVKFLKTRNSRGQRFTYQVDDPDLEDLLGAIASCAADRN
jgi:hypothetical protein